MHLALCISRRDGYTLLELLISISLIGLMLLIIGGAMRLGFRSVDSGERKIESSERFKASLNIIDAQIQSSIPLTVAEEKIGDAGDAGKKYLFKGGRESMQFPTNHSLWGGQKGYVMVTYTVEAGTGGKHMLRATERMIGMESNGRDAKLLDAVDVISFEYFYREPLEEKGMWVEQWTDTGSIPEKVKLHLADGTREFALIIPVRAWGSLQDKVMRAGNL